MPLHHVKNGMQLLTLHKPGGLIHLEFQVIAGHYWAPTEAAHMLEHMLGQFTSSRWPNALKNSERLEALGAECNAHCDGQLARYWLRGPVEHASALAEILRSAYTDFQLDKAVFRAERSALLQELDALESASWRALQEKVQATLFPGHALAMPLTARMKAAKHLQPKDLTTLWRERYVPNVTLFVAAGDLPLDKLIKLLKPLEKLPKSNVPTELTYERPSQLPKEILFVRDSGNLARLQLNFLLDIGLLDDKRWAVDLIVKWCKSRLMTRLRSKLGLVYNVECAAKLDVDPGLSVLEVATYAELIDLPRLYKQVWKALRKPIGRAEWLRLRSVLRTTLLTLEQDLASSVALASEGLLWGAPLFSAAERRAAYDAVSQAQLTTLVNALLEPGRCLVAYSAERRCKALH